MRKPNYTQVPNEILDNIASISPAELKVVMVICRQTFGFQRESKAMSLNEICARSGLSRQGVSNAIEVLVEKDWIKRSSTDGQTYAYEIVFEADEIVEPANSVGGVGKNNLPNQCAGSANSVDRLPANSVGALLKKERKEKLKEREGELFKQENVNPRERLPDEIKPHWDQWVKHLKEKGIKRTPTASELQIKRLLSIPSAAAIAMLEHSTEKGYQGLYAPTEFKTGSRATQTQAPITAEEYANAWK